MRGLGVAVVALVLGQGGPAAADVTWQRVLLDWVFDGFTLGGEAQGFGGDLGQRVGWGGGVTMELGLALPRKLTGLDGLETTFGVRGAFMGTREPILIRDEMVDGGLGLSGLHLALRYRVPVGRLAFHPLAGVSFLEVRQRGGPATGLHVGWLLGGGVDWQAKELTRADGTFALELVARAEVAYHWLDFAPEGAALAGNGVTAGLYFVARWRFADPIGGLEEAF